MANFTEIISADNGAECKKMGSPNFTMKGKTVTQAMIDSRVPGKVVDGVAGKKWREGGDSKLDHEVSSYYRSYDAKHTNDLNYYSRIANTKLIPRRRFPTLTPILDCGAEETSIPERSVPNHTAQIDHVPTVAIYPNGDTTRSSAAVVVQSGSIKLNAKVYKDKNLMRPLIAAHDITSQGNNILLDKHGLTVKCRKCHLKWRWVDTDIVIIII